MVCVLCAVCCWASKKATGNFHVFCVSVTAEQRKVLDSYTLAKKKKVYSGFFPLSFDLLVAFGGAHNESVFRITFSNHN